MSEQNNQFAFGKESFVACYLVYDPENDVYDENEDVDTSITMMSPTIVQTEAIPIGTSAVIQAKVHIDADWLDVQELPAGTGAGLFEYSTVAHPRYNFMRVVRTSGSGNFKVFYQM